VTAPFPEGVTVRPVDPAADLPVVSGLFEACDLADVGYRDHEEDWLSDSWRSPLFAGGWIAERGGIAVGYVELEWHEPSRAIDTFLLVHPTERDRGLRAALLGLQEVETAQRVPDLELIRSTGSASDPTLARDCEAAGYALARTFWHMERSLEPAPEAEPWPPGVVIRAGDHPGDDVVVYEVLEASFREHYASEPRTFDGFLAEYSPHLTDRSMVLIAEVGGRPAGVCLLLMPDAVGWVGDLGVLPEFRSRGLGRALLVGGFAVLASRGATTARLNVDGQNETGATRLYRSVGMDVRREFSVYEKTLRAAG